MKRLFCVKNSKGKKIPLSTFGYVYEGVYTDSKEHAKAVRDEVGGVEKGFHISRGPDHIGKHGHTVPRMRRQPPLRRYS
jgi:hypothetical protein